MHPEPNYDFIMNTEHGPKKKALPKGNSVQSRILIVAGGSFALIMIAVIAFSLISSAGSAGKDQLVKAAQQQAEIVRVSKLGIDRAKGSTAKNLATTVNLGLQSDQAALASAMNNQGITVSDKTLALGKDAATDTTLTTAEQSNRFDEVFIQTIQAQLQAYQQTLQSAYDKTKSQKLKQTLSEQFDHAGLLAASKQ